METQSWLDMTTSLFSCFADNHGNARTFRQILFSDFGNRHRWFYKKDNKMWVNGRSNDVDTIVKIRKGQIDKSIGKQTMQCYTPSGNYQFKGKGREILIHKNPVFQVDLDNLDGYDIEQVKLSIFKLPWTAFVGKSVSGNGVFALFLYEEPERLREYWEHVSYVFTRSGLKPDPTKGLNYTNLRLVSYDANMLCREYPEVLKIRNFRKTPVKQCKPHYSSKYKDGLINWAVREISAAQKNNRSNTINLVCYTLGGYGVSLDEVIDAIINSPQYNGDETEFINKAKASFASGQLKPIAA